MRNKRRNGNRRRIKNGRGKKAEDVKRYYSALKDLEGQFDIIPLEHVVPDPKEKILYIIGNGFDLMHGVRSSYYDFGNTIGKNSHIRFVLENYLESDDLWADFEGALATMNVEAMSQPFVLDTLLDAMDAYDEDAQAADFLLQLRWQQHRQWSLRWN